MGLGTKSSGSKGGHSAKEDDNKDTSNARLLIKFEGDLFELRDIRRVERQSKHSVDTASGLVYALLIRLNSAPYIKTYIYFDESVRNRAYINLENKLLIGNTKIL